MRFPSSHMATLVCMRRWMHVPSNVGYELYGEDDNIFYSKFSSKLEASALNLFLKKTFWLLMVKRSDLL